MNLLKGPQTSERNVVSFHKNNASIYIYIYIYIYIIFKDLAESTHNKRRVHSNF